jgi:predicted ArsR family transcriptional regulator
MRGFPSGPTPHGGTRRQIIDLLRRSAMTVNQLASRLGLTHNAIRSHLSALQREGLVREGGLQRGVSRPAVVYELAPGAELGALNDVESLDGHFVIRGHNCLLAEAVHGRPEVCRAMESLVAELVEVPVRECCERGQRPHCCFEIAAAAPRPQS